ncbi:hypothetical protein NX059_010584 [Plenodomus lindquistii]|nr:hypothetical protein NX059_010584 [Plenodomus lindquistii]
MAILVATKEPPAFLTLIRSLSVSQMIGIAVIVLIARFFLRGLYRIYLHPLRRFPGPKLSAFTRLPHVIAAARGLPHEYAARLHEQYGDVVRISPDELSFLGTNAWRDIYGHGQKSAPGAPPPKYWKWYNLFPGIDSVLTQPDTVLHSKQRKLFMPAFSDRALAQQSPLFTKYSDKLVQVLQDSAQEGKDVDMVRVFNFATFDVMGDLCFGESLHMLDNAEYDPWAIFGGLKASAFKGAIYSYYPIAGAIITLLFGRKINELAKEHETHSSTRVAKRLEKGRESEGEDIWSLVLNAEDKGRGLSKDEMVVNAQLFMAAGTETTATLLSGLTYILLSPAGAPALKKLTEEIRGAFASSEDISMDVLQGLPYLNACINEGLRMYPPVPSALPHRTTAQGSTICDLYVPPQVGQHQIGLFKRLDS